MTKPPDDAVEPTPSVTLPDDAVEPKYWPPTKPPDELCASKLPIKPPADTVDSKSTIKPSDIAVESPSLLIKPTCRSQELCVRP